MKKIFSLIILAVLVGACAPSVVQQQQQQQVAPAPVIPSATPFIDVTSYPTVQAAQTAPTQSVGGFSVNLQRSWRDGKQVYADVCFTLPDTSDWTIWAAHFSYVDQDVSQFSSSMLSKQDAANGQPGLRCDELSFYVPPDANLSASTLTIESIGTYPSGEEYCNLYMPKIQQAMDARGLGITLGCSEVNGALTMQIVSKPATMSDADAQQIVYSDEFYTVKGPWTFSIDLGQ